MNISFIWRGLSVEGEYSPEDRDFDIEAIETVDGKLPFWLEELVMDKYSDDITVKAREVADNLEV